MLIFTLKSDALGNSVKIRSEKNQMGIVKLNIDHSEDFFLWGVLSSYGGHKLCWEMNKALDLTLTRQDDIVLVRRPEAEDAFFNYYSFADEENFLMTELIRNKCNGEFYMRELRNFDFLLMVKGEIDFFEAESFTARLKKLDSIRSVMAIDLDKIKNHEHLILE